jgi:transposase-like protein
MEKSKREAMMMNLKPRVDEMEGARRATGISSAAVLPGGNFKTVVPNPEVPEKASRRRYTAEYKRRILMEAEVCKEQGQVGALLRREGLYFSNLTVWRRQARQGTLDALAAKKRGPKAHKPDPSVRRIAEQEKEIQKLRAKLKKAELIIDAQKKIAEIFQRSHDQKEGVDL